MHRSSHMRHDIQRVVRTSTALRIGQSKYATYLPLTSNCKKLCLTSILLQNACVIITLPPTQYIDGENCTQFISNI